LICPLTELEGITDKIKNTLVQGGFESIRDVLEADEKELTALPGIGVKTVEKIKKALESKS